MNKVALLGYSGHAYVVADTLIQAGFEIAGYFEKSPLKANPFNIPWLGFEQDSDFIEKTKELIFFPAVGENILRRSLIRLLTFNKLEIATILSPKANISIHAKIAAGTIVCQGADINVFTMIGQGVIVNTGAIIEHECKVNDFSHIAPGTVLSGNVTVGENTFIGANSVVKQGVIIGKNVIIGAGSVVLKDIPDNEKWVGNPAKMISTY